MTIMKQDQRVEAKAKFYDVLKKEWLRLTAENTELKAALAAAQDEPTPDELAILADLRRNGLNKSQMLIEMAKEIVSLRRTAQERSARGLKNNT